MVFLDSIGDYRGQWIYLPSRATLTTLPKIHVLEFPLNTAASARILHDLDNLREFYTDDPDGQVLHGPEDGYELFRLAAEKQLAVRFRIVDVPEITVVWRWLTATDGVAYYLDGADLVRVSLFGRRT